MIYRNGTEWIDAERKRILLFGMAGVGKTFVSNLLRGTGDWFHYSVDYRLGTRYLGDSIVDIFKREAMRNKLLASLLRSDSIYIGSNLSFHNLEPISTFLGKPGNPDQGGIPFGEYCRRQELHRQAEISALEDTQEFIDRSFDIYQYQHFVCDSSGSICEVVDPGDPADPLLHRLSNTVLPVWIRESPGHATELAERFDSNPKPMYYRKEFLTEAWRNYCDAYCSSGASVDPDRFVRWAYRRAMEVRQPRYRAMAQRWGVTIDAADVADIKSTERFYQLVANAIDDQNAARPEAQVDAD